MKISQEEIEAALWAPKRGHPDDDMKAALEAAYRVREEREAALRKLGAAIAREFTGVSG